MTEENTDFIDETVDDEGHSIAIRDGKLYLQVTELMLNTRVSRGEYNRNQVYGHVKVMPAVPWVIPIPVEGVQGLEALQVALEKLSGLVTDVARDQVTEMERQEKEGRKSDVQRTVGKKTEYSTGVSVTTPVRTIDSLDLGQRPSMEASVGDEPADDEDDF